MEELHDERIQKCLIDEDHHCVTLVRLLVKEDHRGQGAGSAMVERVKAIGRERRKQVRLIVSPETPDRFNDLVRFYKRHGFAMMRDNETMLWKP